MAVDCAGNLYLTVGQSVRVFTPAGAPLGTITGFMNDNTTNAAFGGPDHRTLYITASRLLFRIQLNIPGLPN